MIGKFLGFIATCTVIGAAGAATAQSSYNIRPGDVLKVEVLEDQGLNRSVLVLPDGSFSFPMAGTVRASGRSVGQVGSALAAALGPNFAAQPNVYVSVDRLNEPKQGTDKAALIGPANGIYIIGEAAKPGKIELARGTTIIQALAEAGGFGKFAATRRIELHRADAQGKEQVYLFDFRNSAGGDKRISGMTVLQPGDVIVVPQRSLFE